MNVHFIAIGGSVMHNLAIALSLKGYTVTGSDDEIFEPARSSLEQYGLLPDSLGWNTAKISTQLDAIVLGMHAKPDNPELLKAKALGIKIYSFPEFLYEQSKHKTRVVIAGSHGKTTITAMILHILKKNDVDFDYMVGAKLQGFDIMVRLSDSAPVMIFEGDEYPDSTINKVPKFHLYHPDIALVSGIAWDHINVFPTFENYVQQFRIFVEMIPESGRLIFNSEDEEVMKIAETVSPNLQKIPYSTPDFYIEAGTTFLKRQDENISLKIFGRHNLQNMMGAIEVCKSLGINEADCLEAIRDFTGAARRLELLDATSCAAVFKDFAHSPSKLKATIAAVNEQFPERKLVACMELHTYSSLNKEFLNEYRNGLKDAAVKIIFYDAHTFEIKRMEPLTPELIHRSFGDDSIIVFTGKDALEKFLKSQPWKNANLLLMSSGNFGGLDLKELSTFVTTHS
ncbi:MAG TPA: Mur ligase family protein [Chitinophagales bacterium]|nr:Mur ligase family protein [Chitinophagales bacterium]